MENEFANFREFWIHQRDNVPDLDPQRLAASHRALWEMLTNPYHPELKEKLFELLRVNDDDEDDLSKDVAIRLRLGLLDREFAPELDYVECPHSECPKGVFPRDAADKHYLIYHPYAASYSREFRVHPYPIQGENAIRELGRKSAFSMILSLCTIDGYNLINSQ